jgi:tricorn protease-like protein
MVAGCGSSGTRQAELVFVSTRDGDYALYGVGGGHEWRLTKARGDPATPAGLFFQIQPAWSPDGSSIAFVSRRDGRSHLYVMHADGSGLRRLTAGPEDDARPAWSPNGRQIAFARSGEVWVVGLRGGAPHRVTHGLGGEAADPAWSPNGKLIAYDYRPPGYSIREIWVVNADGSGAREVTHLRRVSSLPALSPDGKRIAFQSDVHSSNAEIYSVGVDGAGLRRLTQSAIDTIDPAWSSSGTIAFSRDGAIWTLDSTGRAKKLTSGHNDSSPAWRPAG